ncbi:hypothetical protein C0995_000466 [Termitomyces sp. Mi166|nr:hypothetical protein C0995_000466 [Termitomyces sp. Mi166\
MVHLLAPRTPSRTPFPNHHALSQIHKAAATCPLPTRDDILSLLLRPNTTLADLQAITTLLQAAATVSFLPGFKALQLSDTTSRHCVRCHASYTDARNTHGACIVPHVFNNHQYTWIQGNIRIERFVSVIGEGEDARARLVQVGSDACYRGYHTEDVKEIEAEGGYNGINLRRCDEGVCMQDELLKQSMEQPLFADFGAIEPLAPLQTA